ncbi:hypothetical protein SCA6_005282 [Theobroma cacao]
MENHQLFLNASEGIPMVPTLHLLSAVWYCPLRTNYDDCNGKSASPRKYQGFFNGEILDAGLRLSVISCSTLLAIS